MLLEHIKSYFKVLVFPAGFEKGLGPSRARTGVRTVPHRVMKEFRRRPRRVRKGVRIGPRRVRKGVRIMIRVALEKLGAAALVLATFERSNRRNPVFCSWSTQLPPLLLI